MSIFGAIRRGLERPPDASHRCRVCGMQFDSEPLNCPACGTTAIEPA